MQRLAPGWNGFFPETFQNDVLRTGDAIRPEDEFERLMALIKDL